MTSTSPINLDGAREQARGYASAGRRRVGALVWDLVIGAYLAVWTAYVVAHFVVLIAVCFDSLTSTTKHAQIVAGPPVIAWTWIGECDTCKCVEME